MSSLCDGPALPCCEWKSCFTTPTSCFSRLAFGAEEGRVSFVMEVELDMELAVQNSLVGWSSSRCSMSEMSSPRGWPQRDVLGCSSEWVKQGNDVRCMYWHVSLTINQIDPWEFPSIYNNNNDINNTFQDYVLDSWYCNSRVFGTVQAS